jgi:hypothetical protein
MCQECFSFSYVLVRVISLEAAGGAVSADATMYYTFEVYRRTRMPPMKKNSTQKLCLDTYENRKGALRIFSWEDFSMIMGSPICTEAST